MESPHVRESKIFLDSGFHTVDSELQELVWIPIFVSGTWIPVFSGIPDSLSCIPHSKAHDSPFPEKWAIFRQRGRPWHKQMYKPSSFLIAHKLVCVACEDKASISYCQFSAVEFQTTICPLFFSGICNGRNKRTRVKIAMCSRKDMCSFSARVTISSQARTPSSTTSRMFIQLALS